MRLDISSTRVLTVEGDVVATMTGAGATTAAINLTNTAQMDVAGDVSLTRSNTDANPNLDIQLRDDCVMNITGDLSLDMSAGDDVYVDMEDNADLNVTGNVTMTQSGGDEVAFILDDASTCDITGTFTINQSGGDDMRVNLNNNSGTTCTFTVTGASSINKTGGDDISLRSAGANSDLSLNGAITIDCPSAADTEDLIFDANDGDINLAAVTASRSVDMGEIDFDLDGGDITVASLNVTSAGTVNGAASVTIDCDQASNFTCTGNLTVDMTGGGDFRIGLNRNAGTTAQFNCGGSLAVTMSGGDDLTFYAYQNSFLNVSGNLTVTQSGGDQFLWEHQDDGTSDIDGNVVYNHSNGGNTTISIQAASTALLNIDGSMTINNTGGGDEIVMDLDGGDMVVDQGLFMTVSGAGTTEDIDLEMDGDAALAVGNGITATLSGGDDIEIDLGNNSAGATASITVGGPITLTQNVATAGHLVRLLAYDNCTVTSRGLNLTHGNVGGDLMLVHLDNSAVMTIGGDIDMAALGSGDIEIRADNTSELRITGNFDRTPSAFGELDMATTATLEFFGSTQTQVFPQDAGGGGDSFDYGIVEINNTFGTSPQITMEGNATVHGSIVFMDGIVSSGAANLLIIDDDAGQSGASDDSHVDGLMRKAGDDAFEFPVGDAGIWAPIEISAPPAAVNFDAEYFFANHVDASVLAPLAYRSSIEYWTLDPDAATSADVTLHWKDATRSGINSFTADLVVAHYDGADWESYGQNAMLAANPGSVTTNGVTVFSPFTFGSLSSNININPLPIELLSFDAHANGEVVDLSWSTASEVNNDYFVVERSADGQTFEPIIQVDGAGNSAAIIDYFDIDRQPLSGLSYYRLKQVDFDGAFTYSGIVPVMMTDGSSTSVDIFPNPVSHETGQVNLLLSGFEGEEVLVVLRDIAGREFYSKVEVLQSGEELRVMPITHDIPAGVYLVIASSNNSIYSKRLVVE